MSAILLTTVLDSRIPRRRRVRFAFRATIGKRRAPTESLFGILWYKLLAESVALGRIHKLKPLNGFILSF